MLTGATLGKKIIGFYNTSQQEAMLNPLVTGCVRVQHWVK